MIQISQNDILTLINQLDNLLEQREKEKHQNEAA